MQVPLNSMEGLKAHVSILRSPFINYMILSISPKISIPFFLPAQCSHATKLSTIKWHDACKQLGPESGICSNVSAIVFIDIAMVTITTEL